MRGQGVFGRESHVLDWSKRLGFGKPHVLLQNISPAISDLSANIVQPMSKFDSREELRKLNTVLSSLQFSFSSKEELWTLNAFV